MDTTLSLRTLNRRTLMHQKNRGFTLVELMIVVAIIGVLAALAVYGVSKYLGAAKSVEAKNSLGAIGKGVIASYNAESMTSGIVVAGQSAGLSNAICGSATAQVPAAIASVRGKKYQSADVDWRNPADIGGPGVRPKGFPCLKFTMDTPQYYQYNYVAANVGAGTDTFTATATGDLNNNNVNSTFTLQGAVAAGRLQLAPSIGEVNPDE